MTSLHRGAGKTGIEARLQILKEVKQKGGEQKMGQYFIAVNKTKKEYVTAWEIGGGAKLWEWCANREAGIFPYLLRRSNESGGGDVQHNVPNPQYAGRWAGDEVYLVGDYDSSDLYDKAKAEYANIAKELVAEYNAFIGFGGRTLKYTLQPD
ncbi:hypothetical protein IH575_00365 [Candidatus Dojkabacteria bacterium]|nr:hypothetical protein [Candidatus Dojkabacteria bacterium]